MKYLICNLKANKTYPEMLEFKEHLRTINYSNLELILAPTSIYLSLFKTENIPLCCQDIALNENLNLTGDITISQLKSLDVKYTIIGHHERRKYYHETETNIISKIKNALAHNIKVIYCIGESFEEKERRVTHQVLEKSIARILNNIPKESFKNLIIAYEPTYMISSNIEINPEEIAKIINFLKYLIKDYYDEDIKIIYGGNITPENISKLTPIKNLDGYLIGNSSLDPAKITKIINKISS